MYTTWPSTHWVPMTFRPSMNRGVWQPDSISSKNNPAAGQARYFLLMGGRSTDFNMPRMPRCATEAAKVD